jgi:hypothetical protein
MFAPDMPYKVYEQTFWKSDAWDPLSYGRDYDFSKPFFTQFQELLVAVPHPNLIQKNAVNSEYSNYTVNVKNCYFFGGAATAEDSGYGFPPNVRIRECFDVHTMGDAESCYDSVDIEQSQGLRFSQSCVGCSNSYFLYDCRNCTDCFGCVGLRNKQFYIFNEAHSREEYAKRLTSFMPGTFSGIAAAREKFNELKLGFPRKYAAILKSERVTGDDIVNARDCTYCFDAKREVQNCKYSFRVLDNTKDGYDGLTAWDGTELFYEVMSVTGQRVIGSACIWGGFDVIHSYNCFDCNNVVGCIGLHNKSYCIFNKQYGEGEYKELSPRILAQMDEVPYVDQRGRSYGHGDFFPPDLVPFAYNETLAQDYFPKTKEEAVAMGFRWRETEDKKYQITMKVEKLPDDIHAVSDSILNEVIECAHEDKCNDHCAKAFRIVPQELQFLRKMNVPLPRLCPSCRQMERLRLKNPLRLWHRRCECNGSQSANGRYRNVAAHSHGKSLCPTEFETPYAPDRSEIVYCERCYNAEVV